MKSSDAGQSKSSECFSSEEEEPPEPHDQEATHDEIAGHEATSGEHHQSAMMEAGKVSEDNAASAVAAPGDSHWLDKELASIVGDDEVFEMQVPPVLTPGFSDCVLDLQTITAGFTSLPSQQDQKC